MKQYWVSTKWATGIIDVTNEGIICEAPPIWKREYLGRSLKYFIGKISKHDGYIMANLPRSGRIKNT